MDDVGGYQGNRVQLLVLRKGEVYQGADGLWYFYGKDLYDPHGPYDTEQIAKWQLAIYYQENLG